MNAWTIAWKDILIRFRDRRALLFMLIAPLLLAGILGAAFGGLQQGSGTPNLAIPLVIVNDDKGASGQAFVAALTSGQSAALIAPAPMDNLAAARASVESGQATALLYIPAGFSQALAGSAATSAPSQTVQLQIYTDPALHVSGEIVRLLVTQTASQFSGAVLGRQVAIEQIRRAAGSQAPAAAEIERALAQQSSANSPETSQPSITLKGTTLGSESTSSANLLAYFVPNMLVFFLMFTLFDNTRSILTEQQEGTLKRMISTSTSSAQILLGKLAGSFLTGLAQVIILIVAARVLFQLSWGSSLLALALIVVASVAAITSLGAALAAIAKTSQQVDILAGLITLLSAALSGTFVPLDRMPAWLQHLGMLTINYWSLQGLYDLTVRQQGLSAVLPESEILFGIALVLFILAVWQLRRRIVR